MDKEWTQKNRLKDKKINNNAQGLTLEKWHGETISIKKKGDTSVHGLKGSVKKSKERLVIVSSNSISNVGTNRKTRTRKQKLKEKLLYGYCKQQTGNIAH